MRNVLLLVSTLTLATCLDASLSAQTTPAPPQTLAQKLSQITAQSDTMVGVACALPNSALNCDVNPDSKPPMQSVFKFPLALAVMHQMEAGKLSLDQEVHFLPVDLIPEPVYSPLQTSHPAANVDVPLRELLRLSVSLSDNTASDILLRLVGGPAAVQAYIASLGVKDFHLVSTEKVLHEDAHNQFDNWFSPRAAVQLLRLFADQSPLNAADALMMSQWMSTYPAGRPNRIKSGVPDGVVVRHKTGTSDTVLGLTYATNDIALITLPDGRNLALAVFLTTSTDKPEDNDATIAAIAKAVYEDAIKEEAIKPAQ